MQFNIRHKSAYKVIDVSVKHGGTEIDLGWLDYKEAEVLAAHLMDVAEDLLYYIPKPEEGEDGD